MTTNSVRENNDLEELKLAHRLLGSFSEIAEVINAPRLDFDSRMAAILKIILEYLGVEHGSIMILEKKKYLMVRAASRPELIGHRQTIDNDSVASWVARQREPLYVPDIAKDPRFSRHQGKGYKKNSLLSVPIIHKGKVIGIINVTDKIGDRDLRQGDIARLLDFSSVILSLVVQQNLQDELKKQRNTLKLRNKELQKQQEMRAELSKMLVHDLKGPLSEVVANLDILSYSMPEESREFLEAAQMGCNRAVRMVANLTTIDKIEDGKLQLIKEEASPLNILQETLSSMKGLARIKNMTLNLVLPEEDILTVNLDRVLILRVLQNLLTNALGYSPPNTTVTFGCLKPAGKGWIEFYVQDQGPGIPEEKQKSIFEKYARISDKQDSLVGTGLGLCFCKLAVALHRGEIDVDSRPGKGSRFFFSLPL